MPDLKPDQLIEPRVITLLGQQGGRCQATLRQVRIGYRTLITAQGPAQTAHPCSALQGLRHQRVGFGIGGGGGVGARRNPPLWMRDGDVCEIEISEIGVLRNPVVNEAA